MEKFKTEKFKNTGISLDKVANSNMKRFESDPDALKPVEVLR